MLFHGYDLFYDLKFDHRTSKQGGSSQSEIRQTLALPASTFPCPCSRISGEGMKFLPGFFAKSSDMLFKAQCLIKNYP